MLPQNLNTQPDLGNIMRQISLIISPQDDGLYQFVDHLCSEGQLENICSAMKNVKRVQSRQYILQGKGLFVYTYWADTWCPELADSLCNIFSAAAASTISSHHQ